MESIIECLEGAIIKRVPLFDLSPISGKSHGKLKLSPEQLLRVIHGRVFGALGLDNQSAVHLTTLETWTRRASAQLCRLQHFADGSGANGVAQIV